MSDTPETDRIDFIHTLAGPVFYAMKRMERQRDSALSELKAIRTELERVHHECGLDLPDSDLTALELVGSLLRKTTDR